MVKRTFSATPTIFRNSFSDGQVGVFQGRQRPQEPQAQSVAVEVVVAADGSGNFLTIGEATSFLGTSAGIIHVKAGTYTITETITLNANQELTGSGYGTLIDTTMDDAMIESTGARVRIHNLRLDGSDAGTSQVGINLTGAECIVRDCWILNMGGSGVTSTGDNFLLTGTKVEDCDSNCVNVSGDFNRISDCEINNGSADGIAVTSSIGTTIIGCQVMNHGDHGIDSTSSTQLCIVGNYIFSNGDNNTNGDGIELSSSNDCCVVGNVLHTNDGYGIDIQTGSTKNVITGNTILNNEDGAVLDNGTSTFYQTATDSDPLNVVA